MLCDPVDEFTTQFSSSIGYKWRSRSKRLSRQHSKMSMTEKKHYYGLLLLQCFAVVFNQCELSRAAEVQMEKEVIRDPKEKE